MSYQSGLMDARITIARRVDATEQFGDVGGRYEIIGDRWAWPTFNKGMKSLREGALDGRHYVYRESDVCELLLPEKVEEFDRQFPPKEKAWMPSQEKFYIYSHSTVG